MTTFKGSASILEFLIIAAFAQLQVAHAWLGDDPQETNTVPLAIRSWKLEPTAAPMGDALELFKRQTQLPTSVCGYISNELSNSITCGVGYCGYNSAFSAAACCNTYYISTGTPTLTSCSFHTACYDSTAVAQCSGSCATNSDVLKCTYGSDSLCYTFTYTDIDYSILGCSATKSVVSVGQFAVASPTITPTFSSQVAPQSLPGWVTTTFTGVSFTNAPIGTVTASPVSTSASAISGGASTHVGVIAAAVIGAAALALVIGGLVLYFCLRKKTESRR